MSTRVCLFNHIVLTGESGAGEEQVGPEFGTAVAIVPVQVGLIGFEEGEAVAVAVVAVVIITKVICVCGLLFIECMFAPLCGVVLQTIIGFFAASFAAVLSNFSGDIINYINGYEFAAEHAAHFPISNGLFIVGMDTHIIMVCVFIAVILFSIDGLQSRFYGYGFAPATDTTYDNGSNDNGSAPRGAAIIGTIGRYFKSFNVYFWAALTAITVTAVVAVGIGFEFKDVFSPPQQPTVTTVTTRIGFEYDPTNGILATRNNNDIGGLYSTEIGFEFSGTLCDTQNTLIAEIMKIIILNEKDNEYNILECENDINGYAATFNYVHHVQDLFYFTLKYYHNVVGLCVLLLIFFIFFTFFAPISGISFIDNDIYQKYSQWTDVQISNTTTDGVYQDIALLQRKKLLILKEQSNINDQKKHIIYKLKYYLVFKKIQDILAHNIVFKFFEKEREVRYEVEYGTQVTLTTIITINNDKNLSPLLARSAQTFEKESEGLEAGLSAVDTANNNFIVGLFAALFSAMDAAIIGVLVILAGILSTFIAMEETIIDVLHQNLLHAVLSVFVSEILFYY